MLLSDDLLWSIYYGNQCFKNIKIMPAMCWVVDIRHTHPSGDVNSNEMFNPVKCIAGKNNGYISKYNLSI